MPAKLPRGKEPKKGFTVSIEQSWKDRFMIACHNKSVADGTNIVSSHLVREFIIKKAQEFEDYVQKKSNGKKG